MAVCPICGKTYTEHPALSMKDNKTGICPDCAREEAREAVREYMKKEKEKKGR